MVKAVSTSSQTSDRVSAIPFPSAAKVTGESKVSTNRVGVRSFRMSVERLAVQRRGRRTSGSLMLLQFPCGDCVRCNGLFDGRAYHGP